MDIIETLLTPVDFLLRPVVRHYQKKMRVRREIANEVLISTEWTVITPQPPLGIEKPLQEISLELEDCRRNMKGEKLIFSDGTIIDPKSEIVVEIFDEDGNKYSLSSGRYSVNDFDKKSQTFAVHSSGFSTRSDSLPKDKTYTEVRIRSKKPFRCKKVIWHNYKLK